ncbi:MAG: hypothetical protein LBT74_02545 [Acidobacteriota bacterium]|jgi:hypothetical protein|nr:hypothetical protein [Acidobacteriota bacterium]
MRAEMYNNDFIINCENDHEAGKIEVFLDSIGVKTIKAPEKYDEAIIDFYGNIKAQIEAAASADESRAREEGDLEETAEAVKAPQKTVLPPYATSNWR